MGAGKYWALLSGVSLVAVAASVPAGAQQAATPQAGKVRTGIEEVVVTARKKAERLQSVPVSVTALTGSQLREKAIYQSTDLQYSTPSLTVATAAAGNEITYSIRGQGAGFQGNPGVITYFAGAPSKSSFPM